MIPELEPYPAMKKSGVPWLGKVPEHWKVLPNRAIFTEVKERNHPEEHMLSVTITKGVILQQALLEDSSKRDSSNLDKSAYKLVLPGDLAYNKMRAWQGSIGISDLQGIVSPAYVIQRPRKGLEARYLHYLLRTPAFAKEAERWSYGITSDMWSLRPEHFKMIYTCLPPSEEQAAIVRFLDHYDRKIRRYIRAKQKLIKLLEEQKQAIIHRAVTRGLDPYVRLKPSGVEWLGNIPEHWEVWRLKSIVGESIAGPYGSSLTKTMYTAAGYRVYGQQQVIPDNFSAGDYYISEEKYEQMKQYRVIPGDVLVSVMGTVGRVAVVPEDVEPGIINPRLVRYRPDFTRVRPRYLQLTMMSPPARAQLTEGAKGTTMEGLNMQILGRLLLGIPPLLEQDAILAAVHADTDQLSKAMHAASQNINFLREYRTRLIADVVTGKLDVREAAARLPDAAEVQELQEEADALTDEEEDVADDLDAIPKEAEV